MLKICLQCSKEFTVKYDKRRKFCRPGCASSYNIPRRLKKVKSAIHKDCLLCTKDFISDRKGDKFCSRSCSSKYSHPKQNPVVYPCPKCGNPTNYHSNGQRRKMCLECRDSVSRVGKRSIEEMSYSKDPQNKYRKIRHHAHEVARRYLGEKKCSKCPYDKHVELAHIRGIATFTIDTKLSEANDPSNLMWLCPNCHWEFDNP